MASRGLIRQSDAYAIDGDELRRCEAALRRYFRRRTNAADVDDLVQETLTRLLASRRDNDVATPLAYLFRIASNLLADHARSRRRVHFEPCSTEIEGRLSVQPDQEHGTHLSDLQQAYAAALAELSPRCRNIFVRCRHGGLSTADVAVEFGISRRMVQKYMVEALDLLSVQLQPFLAKY